MAVNGDKNFSTDNTFRRPKYNMASKIKLPLARSYYTVTRAIHVTHL